MIDAFLDLGREPRLKGERGSVAVAAPGPRLLFSGERAARRGRFMMLALAAGGRTVAMKCNVLAGAGRPSRSPTTRTTRAIPGRAGGEQAALLMATCNGWTPAPIRATMMNRIWLTRRIATLAQLRAAFVRALPLARRLKRMAFGHPAPRRGW
jgi:hypothetical protein